MTGESACGEASRLIGRISVDEGVVRPRAAGTPTISLGGMVPETTVVRPAATLIVVRDGTPPGGVAALEVLMVRRSLRSPFMGGAYVFPGGTVESGDGAAADLCRGRSDADASVLLGLTAGGLAYFIVQWRSGRRTPSD